MQCGYRGWIIDATPDFSLGKFFARARMVRASLDETVEGEMHIGRDLAWTDTQDEAITAAQEWAYAWIVKHDGETSSLVAGMHSGIVGAVPVKVGTTH